MKTLKIYYELRDNGDVLPEMESEIRNVVEKYGYQWTGQGVNYIDGIRDICFEKEDCDFLKGERSNDANKLQP
uniref:Uncharacterized protein n=1 Tax=viral metagenome TaxID=1070528 RepID=A0A6M3K624_9ZZZZ